MPDALFTIVTAAYNCGSDLDIVANSIRQQKRSDVEFVVIDGGSTDGTLDSIRRNSDVITKYISEPDNGIYDALNKGIRLAQGRYIGVLGADDYLEDGALDLVERAIRAEAADIIAGQTRFVHADGRSELRIDEVFGPGSLISGIPFGHNAMFVSALAYKRVGLYDISYRITADAQWAHRAVDAQMRALYLPAVLVNFGMGGVSSSDGDRIMRETGRTIRENFPELDQEEALTCLYVVRGWRPVAHVLPILEAYNNPRLTGAVADGLALRQNGPVVLADLYPDLMAWEDRKALDLHRTLDLSALVDKTPVAQQIPSVAEPFFSFVIPAYNAASFIRPCLDSILSQSFGSFEIIVVDDGSTDNTPSILAEYAARDARIRVHRQKNARQGAARTAGLGLATGQYVWCIDADDYIQTSILAKYHATIAAKQPDVIVLNFAYVEADGSLRYSDRVAGDMAGAEDSPQKTEPFFNAVSAWSCPPWRYVIRREIIAKHKLSFPAGLYYEDHPFAVELMLRAGSVYVDPSIGYFYVQREGSTMNVNDDRIMDFLPIRRKCLSLLSEFDVLDKFPNISCDYIIPSQFLYYHVGKEYWQKFLISIADDITDRERDLVRVFGTTCQRAILEELLKLRLDGIFRHDAILSTFSLPADPYSVQAVTVGAEASSLYTPEGPYLELGLDKVFQWMSGAELRIRPVQQIPGRCNFTLCFNNFLDDQIVTMSVNGKNCRMLHIKEADKSKTYEISFEWEEEENPLRIVRVNVSRTMQSHGRQLGLLIREIRIAGAEEADVAWPRQRVVVGKGSTTSEFGVDVRVNPQDRTYVRIGQESQVSGYYVFERGVGTVSIGSRTSIGSRCLFVCSQEDGIHIGNHVMLSWDVTVMDTDAHSLDPEVRANDAFDWQAGQIVQKAGAYKDWAAVRSSPIRIEDNAWIGFGASILKGVVVGRGAVVGAKSVVTRSVPAFTVYAGNPARFVRLVPRCDWQYHEIVNAARVAPEFKDALEKEYLGDDLAAQVQALMSSSDWASQLAALKQLGVLAGAHVLQVGNLAVAVAFAVEGYNVAVMGTGIGGTETEQELKAGLKKIERVFPAAVARLTYVASNDDLLPAVYDGVHIRRHISAGAEPEETLRRISVALRPSGVLMADGEGLDNDLRPLPEPFTPYYQVRAPGAFAAKSWMKALGYATSGGPSGWFIKAGEARRDGVKRADGELRARKATQSNSTLRKAND